MGTSLSKETKKNIFLTLQEQHQSKISKLNRRCNRTMNQIKKLKVNLESLRESTISLLSSEEETTEKSVEIIDTEKSVEIIEVAELVAAGRKAASAASPTVAKS